MGRTKERREKDEKGKQDITHIPEGGAEEEERFLQPGKPLISRQISSDRRELWGFRGEQSNQWQVGPSHNTVCPSLKSVSISVDGGWVLECRIWREGPGRGLLLAPRRQLEGTGERSSTTRNAHEGSPDSHRNEPPCLSYMQRMGPPLHSLCTCASPCFPEY